MADTNVIGNSSSYTCFIGDAAAGSCTYAWYMTPEEIAMTYSTPAFVKETLPNDMTLITQKGLQQATFTLKNVLIRAVGASAAFAQFELLKSALMYWNSGGIEGATNKKGFGLYFVAKDVGGNEWSKMGTYKLPTTMASIRARIIDPMQLIPISNGDFMIRELRVTRTKEA